MKEGLNLQIYYLSWNNTKWKASLDWKLNFHHTYIDDITHTDQIIKYIAYDGSNWEAYAQNDSGLYFAHSNSNWANKHYDSVIRFLGWDGSTQWSATIDRGENDFYCFLVKKGWP